MSNLTHKVNDTLITYCTKNITRVGPYNYILKGQYNKQYLNTYILISLSIHNYSRPSINLVGSIISQNSIPTQTKWQILFGIFLFPFTRRIFLLSLTLTKCNLQVRYCNVQYYYEFYCNVQYYYVVYCNVQYMLGHHAVCHYRCQ